MAEHGEKLNRIQHIVEQLAIKQRDQKNNVSDVKLSRSLMDTGIVVAVIFVIQYILKLWSDRSVEARETW